MSCPCHVEVILAEKSAPVKKEARAPPLPRASPVCTRVCPFALQGGFPRCSGGPPDAAAAAPAATASLGRAPCCAARRSPFTLPLARRRGNPQCLRSRPTSSAQPPVHLPARAGGAGAQAVAQAGGAEAAHVRHQERVSALARLVSRRRGAAAGRRLQVNATRGEMPCCTTPRCPPAQTASTTADRASGDPGCGGGGGTHAATRASIAAA